VRILQVRVTGYKGIDAAFSWAPALVFFGRNDAGKSNILEAIAASAGIEPTRTDALVDQEFEETSVRFVVELEKLDDEQSLDARLLAAVLQVRSLSKRRMRHDLIPKGNRTAGEEIST